MNPMKSYMLLALSFFFFTCSYSQDKYFTKTGKVSFVSDAPMEKIEGNNKTVIAVMDAKSGKLQFALQMKSFEFEKTLMQEHFNENYVESGRFPKAEFKGSILNHADINYKKDGSYPAKVKGQLTIHGQTKDVETKGLVKVKGGKIYTESTFDILLSDYNISIPSLVKEKVSNSVAISMECILEPLK